MNKNNVVRALIDRVEAQKEEIEKSLREAQASIIDAPGPMQSHSDTTRYQKAILAGSAASSLREKTLALSALHQILALDAGKYIDKVQVGTLVTLLDEEDVMENYIIVPHCGGISVEEGIESIVSITPESPLASELLGKARGQSVTFSASGNFRVRTIFDLY